jgi:hypothetical protein
MAFWIYGIWKYTSKSLRYNEHQYQYYFLRIFTYLFRRHLEIYRSKHFLENTKSFSHPTATNVTSHTEFWKSNGYFIRFWQGDQYRALRMRIPRRIDANIMALWKMEPCTNVTQASRKN